MAKFAITNIGKDLYSNTVNKVGSNVIHVEIAGYEFDFSMVAPHQSELRKAKARLNNFTKEEALKTIRKNFMQVPKY